MVKLRWFGWFRKNKDDHCTGVHDGKAAAACKKHDRAYGKIYELRLKEDQEFLFDMIWNEVWIVKAWIYYYGVRTFGRFFV